MAQILGPAIALARDGFPVQPTVATAWKNSGLFVFALQLNTHLILSLEKLLQTTLNGCELLLNGFSPKEGEIMTNLSLARTLELIRDGKVCSELQLTPLSFRTPSIRARLLLPS
jgi:gamma-glutamyltranspeptidase